MRYTIGLAALAAVLGGCGGSDDAPGAAGASGAGDGASGSASDGGSASDAGSSGGGRDGSTGGGGASDAGGGGHPDAGGVASDGGAGPGAGDAGAGAGDGGVVPGEEDDAVIESAEFPSALDCGATATATVVVRNAGTAAWTREGGYKLGAVDDADPLHPGDARVWLPEDARVAPGERYTFAIELVAPREAGVLTTDWRMVHEGVRWFGASVSRDVEVACAPRPRRTGRVRLQGNSLVDDGGAFNALGATVMWAAWAYKFDRPKLERTLDLLSQNGFHYLRALGVVGDPDRPDYWDGREIDDAWTDYAEVIAGVTDLAYDTYGLRLEWTLIGDGQVSVPSEAERYALVDTFLAMSVGREQKLMHFELANEAWQNGFGGDAGVTQLRALTRYMNERTDVLVAASAPDGHECADYQRLYAGGVADIATIHFDRDVSKADGAWRPVRQPWELEYCDDVPVGSNNEPIGPGASVASDEDPERLVAGAINTYVSGLPLYVFHTRAGVRGDEELADMPGVTSFRHVSAVVPGELASWSRKNAHWADSPFKVFAGDSSGALQPDTMWPDLSGPTSGVVRAYGGVSGDAFFALPIGILGRVFVEPRRAMSLDVVDPMTGETLRHLEPAAGERVELSGRSVLVLEGRFR